MCTIDAAINGGTGLTDPKMSTGTALKLTAPEKAGFTLNFRIRTQIHLAYLSNMTAR